MMRTSLFRRQGLVPALCIAATLAATPLIAQPEALLQGINRNVGAMAVTASLGYQGGAQVAVNPNNPDQIVAVADTDWAAFTQQCEEPVAVFYSGDGGTTWQAACAPGVGAYTALGLKSAGCFEILYGGYPVVAWDDANRVFLSHSWICSGRLSGDDYIGYYSSNNATAANHPQLVVTYQ